MEEFDNARESLRFAASQVRVLMLPSTELQDIDWAALALALALALAHVLQDLAARLDRNLDRARRAWRQYQNPLPPQESGHGRLHGAKRPAGLAGDLRARKFSYVVDFNELGI